MRFPFELFFIVVSACASASATPIEGFSMPVDLTCMAGKSCGRVLPSDDSLGRSWAFALITAKEGKTRIYATPAQTENDKPAKFGVQGKGDSWTKVVLTWDGDLNPVQLSSAGLGCVDLTAYGATAIALRAFKVSCECEKSKRCVIQIETRLYDGKDPTGQRYSTSFIRRQPDSSGKDLFIPFSSFGREGPNGPGNPACVGAISVTFQPQGIEEAAFSLSGVMTNSGKRVVALPTEAALAPVVSASPIITVASVETVTMTPTSSPSLAEPSPTVTALPTVTSTPTLTVTPASTPSATATPTLQPTVTTTETPVPEIVALETPGSASGSPSVGTAVPSLTSEPPATPALQPPTPTPRPTPEEVIYGEVFAGRKGNP